MSLLLSGRVAGESVTIEMPGGELSVSLHKADGRAFDLLLTGPTAVVEKGEFRL